MNSNSPEYKGLKDRLPQNVRNKIKVRESLRLNQFIAKAGVCSRREADDLIKEGHIKVNNEVVTEMGYQVKKTDKIFYKNTRLHIEKMVYVLLNKSKNHVTTTSDPEERKTVLDLVKDAATERIYPVGRLDRNTTGLILLTNDGDLAQKLAHPSNKIPKIYQAELDRPILQEDFDKLFKEIELKDGPVKIDQVAVVTADNKVLGIEIHSGRNRIIRRIFEHLGYEVVKLDRTAYAGLDKKNIGRGEWRYLTEKEVIRIKYFI
jgi:23S rRNA pseudouridine2605 synthase